jgi:predicted RNA binding protein YcfA (HicA-like mRNA interferase family)
MPGLPTQLPWRRFVCVLRKLGYATQKGKAGAARSFTNPNRMPKVISLREPHPGENLGTRALRRYLRQLLLDDDEFMHLLEDC